VLAFNPTSLLREYLCSRLSSLTLRALTLLFTLTFLIAEGLCSRLRSLTLRALTLLFTLAFLIAEGLCSRLRSLTLRALTLPLTHGLSSVTLLHLNLLRLLASLSCDLCYHSLDSRPYVAYALSLRKCMI
jgi:hypothetical protein